MRSSAYQDTRIMDLAHWLIVILSIVIVVLLVRAVREIFFSGRGGASASMANEEDEDDVPRGFPDVDHFTRPSSFLDGAEERIEVDLSRVPKRRPNVRRRVRQAFRAVGAAASSARQRLPGRPGRPRPGREHENSGLEGAVKADTK